ncbi:MAG: hypothetical protein ACTHZD_16095 [Micrococcaceae bacterium]
MSTVVDHHGYQVYPIPRAGASRGISWHLHRACDADQRAKYPEVAELATDLTITDRAA